MTTHPKPFVLGLCFCIFLFCPSVFVCVFPVSLWTFHQTSTVLPLNTPKKNSPRTRTLVCMSEERVKCPQKSFLFELVLLFLCHHKFFLVCFLSMTERVSDWRLWDNRERGSDREMNLGMRRILTAHKQTQTISCTTNKRFIWREID